MGEATIVPLRLFLGLLIGLSPRWRGLLAAVRKRWGIFHNRVVDGTRLANRWDSPIRNVQEDRGGY